VTAPQTSLYAALRSYFDSVETSNCRVWITVDGDDMRISEELSTELFLILREALGNALHHARTDAVELDIKIDRERVVCQVTDRGIGFDPEQERISGHTGLLSMRERAQSVNGDFAIRSSPGRGTEILVVAPLDPHAPTAWKCAVELLD
jgi:signal transduction histidine kinase